MYFSSRFHSRGQLLGDFFCSILLFGSLPLDHGGEKAVKQPQRENERIKEIIQGLTEILY
jgi:hypothetical protein